MLPPYPHASHRPPQGPNTHCPMVNAPAPARGPRVLPPYPHASHRPPQGPNTHCPMVNAPATTRGPRVSPPYPHTHSQPPLRPNTHRPMVNVPAPVHGPRVPPHYVQAPLYQSQPLQRMINHWFDLPAQAQRSRTPSALRRQINYNRRLRTRGPRVPPPHLQQLPPPPIDHVQGTRMPQHRMQPTVQVRDARVPQHCMQHHPPPTVQARYARVPPHYGQSHSPPTRLVPGTQPPSLISQRQRAQSEYTRQQQAILDNLFRVDQCYLIHMDESDFDAALNDAYFFYRRWCNQHYISFFLYSIY